MDTTDQWPQEAAPPASDQKKLMKPQKDQAPLNCPRCHSTNTKFCYYNNYSLTQPRYFCKSCRRYWTAGGSLRNVPVGGGSRKNNKRPSNINPLVSKTASASDDHLSSSHFSFQNPNIYTGDDQNHNHLNLAFPVPPPTQEYNSLHASRFLQPPSKNAEMNKDNTTIQLNLNSSYSTSSPPASTSLSAMELLKLNSTTGFPSRAFVPVAPLQNPNMIMQYGSGGFHSFQEFSKPQLGFSVDGHQRNGGNQEISINGAADHQRLNFPFGAPSSSSKHISSANGVADNQDKVDGNPALYWNGMLSGGSW